MTAATIRLSNKAPEAQIPLAKSRLMKYQGGLPSRATPMKLKPFHDWLVEVKNKLLGAEYYHETTSTPGSSQLNERPLEGVG